jgi:hypothetical protein
LILIRSKNIAQRPVKVRAATEAGKTTPTLIAEEPRAAVIRLCDPKYSKGVQLVINQNANLETQPFQLGKLTSEGSFVEVLALPEKVKAEKQIRSYVPQKTKLGKKTMRYCPASNYIVAGVKNHNIVKWFLRHPAKRKPSVADDPH